jgi:hypothetical protein
VGTKSKSTEQQEYLVGIVEASETTQDIFNKNFSWKMRQRLGKNGMKRAMT